MQSIHCKLITVIFIDVKVKGGNAQGQSSIWVVKVIKVVELHGYSRGGYA